MMELTKLMANNKATFAILFFAVNYFGILDDSVADKLTADGLNNSSTVSKQLQYANNAFNKYRPLKCNKSKAPLFQADSSDILKLEIISDFNRINTDTYDEEGGDYGIVLYFTKKGDKEYIPVFIKDRGNSRRDACDWVPLRIIFEDPIVKNNLDRIFSTLPKDFDPLVGRYNKLKSQKNGLPLLNGASQHRNIFRKLGDDIKLVTHCGRSSWKRVGGDTQEQQESRLLQEYYIYQVLDQMQSTTLKTRLAEITYKDPAGNTMVTRKAFFREPKAKLAKRCGLSNKPYKDVTNTTFDVVSSFQLDLYNKFAYSHDYDKDDGRNINILYGKDGQNYMGPYDFDLSGIIVPEYRPNGKTLEQNLKDIFRPWLQEQEKSEMAIVQVLFMLSKKAKMRNVILNSVLDDDTKAHMLNWFDSYTDALEEFITINKGFNPELIKGLEMRDLLGKVSNK